MNAVEIDSQREQSNKNTATLVYALQTLGFFIAFTFVIGVIVNYVKYDDVRGTWLESHFRWQIRTFWYGLLWSVIGFITFFIPIGWLIWFIAAVWVIYRIVKGWLYLVDDKSLY